MPRPLSVNKQRSGCPIFSPPLRKGGSEKPHLTSARSSEIFSPAGYHLLSVQQTTKRGHHLFDLAQGQALSPLLRKGGSRRTPPRNEQTLNLAPCPTSPIYSRITSLIVGDAVLARTSLRNPEPALRHLRRGAVVRPEGPWSSFSCTTPPARSRPSKLNPSGQA